MILMAKNRSKSRNRHVRDPPMLEKDRIYFQKKLNSNKNVDVRYWKNIRELKEKISSSFACNQERCPVMKQRLDLHLREKHSNGLSDTLSVTPKPKSPRNSRRSSTSSSTTQTSSYKDQSEGTENEPLHKTYEILNPVVYKKDLENVIHKWLKNVPIYQYTIEQEDIDNAINTLITNINVLANNAENIDYEDNIKNEIEQFLDTPGMWYPDDNAEDESLIKDSLKNDLWKSITEINDTQFVNNKGDTVNSYYKEGGNQVNYIYGYNTNLDVRYSVTETKNDVESEICDWLDDIKRTNKVNKAKLGKNETVQLFLTRLTPILAQQRFTPNFKANLKKEIVSILNELRICSYYPKNKNIYLDKYAESLSNRLANIRTRNQSFDECLNVRNILQTENVENEFKENNLKHTLLEAVSDCFENRNNDICSDIVEDITDIIIDNYDCSKTKKDNVVHEEISNILRGTCDISVVDASNIAQQIVDLADEILSRDDTAVSTTDLRPSLSGILSVYTIANNSKSKKVSKPVTSTPKAKDGKNKTIEKLNPDENSYKSKLDNLIRAWMGTLPKQFHKPEDKNFKEKIVSELATSIFDESKLAQTVPHSDADKQRFISYFVLVWLQKYKICTDLNASKHQGDILAEKIMEIPTPILKRSRQGSLQDVKNIKHTGNTSKSVPNVSNVLVDDISSWMNEQPSNIYTTNDKNARRKMVQELADKVKTPLANKRPHAEILKEVTQWLSKIVQPGQKNNVGKLSEKLKDRIVKYPQNQTLGGNQTKEKQVFYASQDYDLPSPIPVTSLPLADDTDRTLQEYIKGYIDHNYDMDDPMARGAFTNLLKTEIQRLSPPTRKEVYDNFMKSGQRKYFSTEQLDKELMYAKDVADWLKILPLNSTNAEENKFYVEFINNLARDIYEIEDRRVKAPDEMDHEAYLESIILVHASLLPINQNEINNQVIKALMNKITAKRSRGCCQTPLNAKKLYKKEEIGDFIEEYVQENSRIEDDDAIKMNACSARLLKEVKQIVQETADPATLSKDKVYENLNQAPTSGDESVRRFNLALDYAKEITEWIKNLPLLPVSNQPEAQEAGMKMISELAEKMVGRHCKKAANPTDTQVDEELVDFVQNWISELPLDPQREIVYPVVVSQLMNRMKKVDMKLQKPQTPSEITPKKINKTNKETKRGSNYKPKKIIPSITKIPPGKTGEGLLVDAIEQWCNNIPIKGQDDIETKAIKDDVAKNLYQRVGELNANPGTYNDDLLYREMVADEIDTLLDNVPQNPELQNNKEKLKAALLQAIMDARHIMKETSAGDNYKHKLEKTIESSVPNPKQNQSRDPAFEIYKNRLAEEFILENFDHGNDAVKMNYEKRIKSDIDKYFRSAQNRNAIPLSKDQIYNELYSSLFKVPIPNENSIVEEVEEVKTKCEIDKWFQDLPLRQAAGVGELLEWDNILSTLAKRIREIEKNESEPNEKIYKEITKWLMQLPLLPGQQRNVDQLAKKLQDILKSTTGSRKFVPMSSGSQPNIKKSNNEKGNISKILEESRMTGVNRSGQKWAGSSRSLGQSIEKTCCQEPQQQQNSSSEIIQMMVKLWCHDLPIKANTIQEQVDAVNLIDNLISRIMLKIRELNSSPAVLNDSDVYNELLDDALEALLSTLPPNCELQQSKHKRKLSLINAIQRYKPLIIEEKARQEYKKELNETVTEILGGPHSTTASIAVKFNKIMEDIVEDFLEYNYNIADEDAKQAYKMLIHDAVLEYFTDIVQKWDNPSDILMKRNELICELSKIPVPKTAVLKHEVDEIRMKKEVRDFFNSLSLPEDSEEKMTQIYQMETNLAKMLNDIEKGGHNCANDKKMKDEISRCLNKLNIHVEPEVINAFVNKLKNDENDRKAPPLINEPDVQGPCPVAQAYLNRTAPPYQTSCVDPKLVQNLGQKSASILSRTVPASAFRSCGADVTSSLGQPYRAQQTPVADAYRSLLSTCESQPQPLQVPANMIQSVPCQPNGPCKQPTDQRAIPNIFQEPQIPSSLTVPRSSVSQSTGTAPITGLFEGLPMARAPKPDRPGSHKPRSRPSSEEDECICEVRRPKARRKRPCYPMDYCNDCEDMKPWWGAPYPEKRGLKYSNDEKKKREILRCLKMLNIKADPDVINAFLEKLKNDKQATQEVNENAPNPNYPANRYTLEDRPASALPVQATAPCELNPGLDCPIPSPSYGRGPEIMSCPSEQLYRPQTVPENVNIPQILQPGSCQRQSNQVPNVYQENCPTDNAIPSCQRQIQEPFRQTTSSTALGSCERNKMAEAPDNRPRERRSARRQDRPSRPISEDDEDARRPRNRRDRPQCYYPKDFCYDFEDMMPPWWMMYPGFY